MTVSSDSRSILRVHEGAHTPALVDREEEMRWLRGCMESAFDGQPQVTVLIGEPGIGKTRLLRELQHAAVARGFARAAARGYADVSAPYLLFREALGSRVPALAGASPAGTSDAARQPSAKAQQSLEAASADRAAWIRSAAQAIIDVARTEPLALVLDDLHWADEGSLQLLAHLVFGAADAALEGGVRLLVVASTRDLDATSPSARILARILREPICGRLELRGFEEHAAREMLCQLGVERPSHRLVGWIAATTRGNPLFIETLVAQLLHDGAFLQSAGHWTIADDHTALRLPEDVEQAVAERLRQLGAGCRQILSAAAVLGDRWSASLLREVADAPEAAVESALAEGAREGLLRGDGSRYRFAHALIRQALQLELPASARARLHLRIADALDAGGDAGREPDPFDVARHLIAAGTAADASRVVRRACDAAEHAFACASWDLASTFFEAALDAAARLPDFAEAERARLHYRAAEAHFRDQDAAPCVENFLRARQLYERCGDPRGVVSSLAGWTRAQFTVASVPYGTRIDTASLEETATALAADDPALAGAAFADIAQAEWTARQSERAAEMASRALKIADDLDDARLRAEAERALSLVSMQSLRVGDALTHLENGVAAARRTSDAWLSSHLVQRLPLPLLWTGRLDRVDAACREAAALTSAVHDWGDHSLACAASACAALARGDFERLESDASHAIQLVQRSGYPWAGPLFLPALARARSLRGACLEAEDALATLTQPGAVFEKPGPTIEIAAYIYRQAVRAASGPSDAEREALRESIASLPPPPPDDARDAYAMGVYCALVETCDELGTTALVAEVHEILEEAVARGMVLSLGWVALVPRVLGLSAALLGRREEARRWFETALRSAQECGAHASLARTRADYAALLARSGREDDAERARALLLPALRAFAELGMAPSFERGCRLAVELGIDAERLPAPALEAAARAGLGPLDVAVLVRIASGRTDGEIADELVLSPATVALRVARILTRLEARTRREAIEIARRRGLLVGRVALSAPRRVPAQVVMFTDVGGSTMLFDRLGDLPAYGLQRLHDDLVRDCLARTGGSEVRHTGDGIMASFASAAAAVRCAAEIQRALGRPDSPGLRAGLQVRIGMNAGDVVAASQDLFGVVVNGAARICALARPGQILVSSAVAELCRDGELAMRPLGRFPLRGLSRPFDLLEVVW